jgi:hypothetical protein
MTDTNHPELHVNEEPSNDFIDVGLGMAFSVGIFFVIAIIMTVISIVLR